MKIQEDAEIIPRPLGRAPLLLPELPFSLFSALSVNAFFSLYPQPRLLTFSLCFFFVSPPLVQTLFVSHGPALLFPTQLVAIPTNTMATVSCSAADLPRSPVPPPFQRVVIYPSPPRGALQRWRERLQNKQNK